VATRVAPYKQIHDLTFVDAIPTSPSGKTLRRLLVAADKGADLRRRCSAAQVNASARLNSGKLPAI
jgi:acyl-coenzyme A synthetase/AMP-(fatty) acid ligase